MADAEDALSALTRLGGEPTSSVHLQPAASEAAIREMQSASNRELGEPVPDAYAAFLRVTNGVQINGAYLKSAEDLVPENLDVPRPEIIVLGNAGNVAEYVFDRRDWRFHTINMGFPDERFASFDTFEELLAGILRDQQVR